MAVKDPVEQIAETLLYEGYLLWPYRRAAPKNRTRWMFGGVYPRAFSRATGGHDPWLMQTECLVLGETPAVAVKARFLQIVERCVERKYADGGVDRIEDLQGTPERDLPWQEVTERKVVTPHIQLAVPDAPHHAAIDLPSGTAVEPLAPAGGAVVGSLVRRWHSLQGAVMVDATSMGTGLFKLSVRITNSTPLDDHQDRASALLRTFHSTHTILTVSNGEFLSLLDPPEALKTIAERCENRHTWPVLVGKEGDRRTLLSSPIILYDYPRIAPESHGALFDATEIEQLLTLSILALTDEEKRDMRSDPRTNEILARTEALTAEDFMRLHGTIRERRRADAHETAVPRSVVVNGLGIKPGSKVRLRPRPGGDILDLALAGKTAVVETIEQDYEDRIHVAVTLEEDPARDLGQTRPGRRFFYSPEEVEPIDDDRPDGRNRLDEERSEPA